MQSLTGQNFASRLAFARMVKSKIDRREININRVWFLDEAHFYLNEYVNKQNYRFQGSEIQMWPFLEAYIYGALRFEQLYVLKV